MNFELCLVGIPSRNVSGATTQRPHGPSFRWPESGQEGGQDLAELDASVSETTTWQSSCRSGTAEDQAKPDVPGGAKTLQQHQFLGLWPTEARGFD